MQRILVVGPAWIGDMLIAQTLFDFLKNQNSNTKVDVLAPPSTYPLLDRMPSVDQAYLLPVAHKKLALAQRVQLGLSLRKNHYDTAFVLPRSFKSALIPFFAGIPKRIGYLGEQRYFLLNSYKKLNPKLHPLLADRYLALASSENVEPEQVVWPRLNVDPIHQGQALTQLGATLNHKPILALCPGAEYGPAKRWPPEYFAKVASCMLEQGWNVWIFGSAHEHPLASSIQEKTNNRCLDFTGKTTLQDAIDLMALAHAVISNDSGLMHMAASLRLPLVAIYGSSSPSYTPPLTDPSLVQILRLPLSCSPCFERTCPLQHTRCLHEIKPNRVLQSLKTLGFEFES